MNLALRLKYAGVEETGILIEPDISRALDAIASESKSLVYAMCNYTAMLDLREILADRGLAPRYWA